MRDWRELPLQGAGRSLIEASAGTGKTWTISVLYLRLLLEQPSLSPRCIVVTTFTKAAAEELRERLRGRLLWALSGADLGIPQDAGSNATDLAWLLQRWQADPSQRNRDATRLKLALAELDLAPIGTLHSLCRRILADHPFASGTPFVLGELADGAAVLSEVTRDLWRVFQQGDGDNELVQMLGQLDPKLDEAGLRRMISMVLTPGTRVAQPPALSHEAPLDARCADRLEYFAATEGVLRSNSKLRRGWPALAAWLRDQSQAIPGSLLDELDAATKPTTVLKEFKSNAALQALIAFTVDVCIPLIAERVHLTPRVPPAALVALAEAARRLMTQRLAAANQLRYDDLLLGVHAILCDAQAPVRAAQLADALFHAWPVAMVDEFQDTDALQYGILDRIYRDADANPRGRLVMIGDPKQAIYRFRGGDIHAYLRAASCVKASDHLSLAVNQRSSRAMVQSCNALYALCGEDLSTRTEGAEIAYSAVEASGRRDAEPYTIDGEPVSRPLQVHVEMQLPNLVGDRRALALNACADQIATLLQSDEHRIGEARLMPSDIAVLLPKNDQLDQLRELLRARGVPCVTSSRASVFDTETARELQVLLHAVAHCDDLGALRAALATRLWGMNYAELRGLGDDPARWQAIGDVFCDWQQRWRLRGVQTVVDGLIGRIAMDCLARADGERILTDLRHLGEQLQEQAEHCTGFAELLEWLAEQRAGSMATGEDDAVEARQLRIESDARRVRLMTLHLSKGLEFSIVFLPLMWDHAGKPARSLCMLTDPDSGERRIESTPEAAARDLLELQDESFRVLYVALTRAIHACHVYALPDDESGVITPEQSALQAMLARRRGDDPLKDQHIAWLDHWPLASGASYRDSQPALDGPRQARAMPEAASVPLPSRHSFTTLSRFASGGQLDPEAAALDEAEGLAPELPEAAMETAAEPHPQLLALSSVRGADFGNAVHAILERRSIGLALRDQRDLIRHQLALHNVTSRELTSQQLHERLAERLQAVLDAPLDAASNLSLGTLRTADLRAEMEFNFALQGASMRRLQDICRQPDGSTLVPQSQRTLAGLMTGKIDLCFRHDGRVHVLDYKGNYLGDSLADYRAENLLQKMDAEHYRFQALIYTVAVDRYLRQRISGYRREVHLGDCWYLFVRAVGLAPGIGIWRHRFDVDLLNAVDAELSRGLIGETA